METVNEHLSLEHPQEKIMCCSGKAENQMCWSH